MIWIILIYVISALLFLNILIKDAKVEGVKLSYESILDYYGFNIIFIIVPVINTIIVILWYAVQWYCKFMDRY